MIFSSANSEALNSTSHIPELRMPDPNPFIPNNFTVHKKGTDNVSARYVPINVAFKTSLPLTLFTIRENLV